MPDDLNTAAASQQGQAAPAQADTAALQAAQPSPDTAAGSGQAASGGSDQLILGRFRSVEDLAQAYTNLQAEYTRMRQQMQQPAQPAQTMDPELLREAFELAWNQNPLAVLQSVTRQAVAQTLQPIISQQQALAREMQIRDLALNHADDIQHVAPLMVPILEQNPQLWDQPGGLELAYRAAKAEWLEQVAQQRANAVAQQQVADAVRAQSVVGRGGPGPQPSAEDILKASIKAGRIVQAG